MRGKPDEITCLESSGEAVPLGKRTFYVESRITCSGESICFAPRLNFGSICSFSHIDALERKGVWNASFEHNNVQIHLIPFWSFNSIFKTAHGIHTLKRRQSRKRSRYHINEDDTIQEKKKKANIPEKYESQVREGGRPDFAAGVCIRQHYNCIYGNNPCSQECVYAVGRLEDGIEAPKRN
jgi:hypothetical protein